MSLNGDFVSWRGYVPKAPRVTIHKVPLPFHLVERKRVEPTLAETKRSETEANLKQKRDEPTRSSHNRHIPFRRSVPGPLQIPHDPFRIGLKDWSEYDTDERMTRIHGSVTRIRDEMKRITIQFETITEPNRKQRRAFAAIMKRLHHAIDTMPNR